MDQYDVVVIGGGPAGYVAAIRCAQLGLNTACIDMWLNESEQASLGGTCLNVGCIPSKALLETSEKYEEACHEFAEHGIKTGRMSIDLPQMMARKQKVVDELTDGITALFRTNGVSSINGHARLLKDRRIEIKLQQGTTKKIQANHVILAPGSKPVQIPTLPFDDEYIVDSTGALSFTDVPKRLAIVGAGVIGLELGTVWRRLGAEVSLFEFSPELLPTADKTITRQAKQIFSKQGLTFHFGTQVTSCKMKKNRVELSYKKGDGNTTDVFDKVVVAVGRQPNTMDLCSDDAGLDFDEGGRIAVDEQCRTNLPGVYAIGDAVRGPMLAHKGSEEGMMVAELIAGKAARVNYEIIPFVIYTHPEIAWCGRTEHELKMSETEFKSGTFSFAANGRARAAGHKLGLVKILADAATDRVLGVHIIGPQASELIAQAVIAMEFKASSEDLAMTMFAHPSLSEVIHEAALDINDSAIHKAKTK